MRNNNNNNNNSPAFKLYTVLILTRFLSPADSASQEAVGVLAQRVVVERVWAPHDAAAQYCLDYLASKHPDFELDGSARSVVQFEGVPWEATLCVAYAPVDLDGQVGVVVGVPPEVYEPIRLVVHLACCLYAECGGALRLSLRV